MTDEEHQIMDRLNQAHREFIIDAVAALALCHSGDTERDHVDADKILCACLTNLGYGDIVAAWTEVEKWYA